ncbi:MAG: deoxynucleoside kinase [Promethearchaeota archaeon]
MVKKIYRNKGSKDNIIISIAGAHGVGKSTIFNLLKNKAAEMDDFKFKFFPERYVKNPPFPFGSSNKQIAFRSELHFLQQLIKRNRSVRNFDEKYNGRIIILDRTPLCVLIYSKSLDLKEKDYKLILDTYNSVKWIEDYIIYLSAEPNIILKRIIQRGSLEKVRNEWNEDQRDYLLKILSNYNKMLLTKIEKNKLFIINTDNLTQVEVLKQVENIIINLSDYSFKKQIKPPAKQMSLNKFLK